MKIPFSKTTLGVEEKRAIRKVIDSGWVVQGPKTQEFEAAFAEYVGAKYAVFVDSCTSALFLAIKYTNWASNEIRIPSLTFVATVEAVVNAGYTPKFVESDYDIPVFFSGDKIDGYFDVVDSAHRIARNDYLGAGLWCYSFYATKNLTTVNGGMIITNDETAYNWLKKARDHGISKGTQERYQGGEWDYDIEFVGYRVKADDIRAAIGLEQLKKLDDMTEKRNNIVSQYNAFLGLNRMGNHLYPVFVEERPKFIEFMRNNGIQVSVHYPRGLHQMTAYKKYHDGTPLPYTEWFTEHCVSLPLYPQLTRRQISYVARKVAETKLLIKK